MLVDTRVYTEYDSKMNDRLQQGRMYSVQSTACILEIRMLGQSIVKQPGASHRLRMWRISTALRFLIWKDGAPRWMNGW